MSASAASQDSVVNSAIFNWDGEHGLPQFSLIADEDFATAFDRALMIDRAHIDAIADNPDTPTFENTIAAMEAAVTEDALALTRVASLFFNLTGSRSSEVLRETERKYAPILSRHSSETAANANLFARIDALWQNRASLGLTKEQERVLERRWKGFRRGGAGLPKEQQEELAGINARLAELGATFAQNVLAEESAWSLILGDGQVADLSDDLRQAMRAAAEERGEGSGYAVTLSRSIIEPFLTQSTHRDLREQAFAAWAARGENGDERDNRAIVRETLQLRARKASMLGHKNFAFFKLEDQMAKSPDRVMDLLETVWEKARLKALDEEVALKDMAASQGANHDIKPWDWRHYAEMVRKRDFAFDSSELKPYFSLDAVIQAAFDVANRLFGISFSERSDITAYHDDVRVFEVLNADGSLRAVFLGDYFARPSKRSGAWMSAFQSQHKLGKGQHPIIVNVMNFAKAPQGEATLLSADDARTLFHEFGHALHGLLSDVTYPSVAGTAVARDFVELPSQLFEHWLTVPDVLKKHAKHVETGAPLPQDLLDKMLAAQTFNAGFNAVEFTASALVDMAFHMADAVPDDVVAFERSVLDEIGLPSSIAMRHRTPHFAHVFSGDGYSAGYYSYMWSEVLDADAFTAFEETGDVFNPGIAAKLRREPIFPSVAQWMNGGFGSGQS